MESKALISVSLVHALLKYAENIGVEISDSFIAAGILKTDLNNPEARIPASQFNMLWKDLAQKADDPHAGLHFAETSRSQPSGGVLTTVMFNCPTVSAAMEKLARYHDLSTDLIQVKIYEEEKNTCYTWESSFQPFPGDRHLSEAVICWIFYTLKSLSNLSLPIVEIHFQHQKPQDTSEHQRIFDCPVKFSQTRNQIVVLTENLEIPIPLSNPKLLKRLEAIVQEQLDELYASDSWADLVSHWISKLLLDGQKPALGLIAQAIAVSTRQLQNKLKDEGVTYRFLLDQVRKEMALGYLKEPGINIYDTAFLLGFSDQSSFNHAFKRWTNMTPGEFRG